MDELDFKLALARLAEATAHAIKTNDPDVCIGFSKAIRAEVEEENNRRRIIAGRRSAVTVKELQMKSGMGLYSCKNALEKAEWDIDRAMDILRKGVQA